MKHTHTHTHTTLFTYLKSLLSQSIGLVKFRRSLGVIESPELLESSGMGSSLVLSCNIQSFVIELNYGYPYLLEVYSELSNISFMIWLHYHSMLALHDRPMLAMVNILALELVGGIAQPIRLMGLMQRPRDLFVNIVPTRGPGLNCHPPLILYIAGPRGQIGTLSPPMSNFTLLS